jgi:hypothetical protein
MARSRAQFVDAAVTGWYHCITRCVRRAHFLCEGLVDRKKWLEDRLRELSVSSPSPWPGSA